MNFQNRIPEVIVVGALILLGVNYYRVLLSRGYLSAGNNLIKPMSLFGLPLFMLPVGLGLWQVSLQVPSELTVMVLTGKIGLIAVMSSVVLEYRRFKKYEKYYKEQIALIPQKTEEDKGKRMYETVKKEYKPSLLNKVFTGLVMLFIMYRLFKLFMNVPKQEHTSVINGHSQTQLQTNGQEIKGNPQR